MRLLELKFQDIPHYIYWLKIKLYIGFWGRINNISARYWGLNLGNACSFYGRTYFCRHRDSSIIIGNDCTFYSKIAANLYNRSCSIITYSKNAKIKIGNNVGMSGTVIGAHKSIIIGNNVRCGANTFIFDSDFHIGDYRVGEPKEVIIHDNVWLGINVIVLKGVTIGENSVIGAGSVVIKNIPANVIAAGNPCKVIKDII